MHGKTFHACSLKSNIPALDSVHIFSWEKHVLGERVSVDLIYTIFGKYFNENCQDRSPGYNNMSQVNGSCFALPARTEEGY